MAAGSGSETAELSSTERARVLGQLLLTEDDFAAHSMDVYLNGDTFPLTEEHRDYSPPPEELCPDGGRIDPLGTGAVYASIYGHDAWVSGGEWIAGEPSADAVGRFEATAEVIQHCVEAFAEPSADTNATMVALDLSHPGIDEVTGLSVVADGEPVYELVYARRDGLLMLMGLDGPVDPDGAGGWLPNERDTIMDLALDKLAAAERTEWSVASAPVDPSISTVDPGEATDVLTADARCTVNDLLTPPNAASGVSLPSATPANVRWQIDARDAFDSNTLPNDAADAGIAYGRDQTIVFLDHDGGERWTWDSDEAHDVDIGDDVYVVGRDESDQVLVALDETNGEQSWAIRLNGGAYAWSSVEAIGPSVYVGGRHQVGTSFGPALAAFDEATGAARWQAQADLLGGDGELALLTTGFEDIGAPCSVVAVDATLGELRWAAVPTPEPFVPVTIAAVAVDGEVFIASRATSYQTAGSGRVVVQAMDADTGEELWTQVMPWDPAYPDGRLWLVADDDAVYVQANMGDDTFTAAVTNVAAFDRAEGTSIWSSRIEGVGYVSHGLQQTEDELLIPAETSVIHLSAADGTPTKVETVPFEWIGELIVTAAGPVLLGSPAVAAIEAT